jgi:hypothetical protein
MRKIMPCAYIEFETLDGKKTSIQCSASVCRSELLILGGALPPLPQMGSCDGAKAFACATDVISPHKARTPKMKTQQLVSLRQNHFRMSAIQFMVLRFAFYMRANENNQI